MPTVRNAKGADLYASSDDERTIHPIQVKAHAGKPQDTSLGINPERLVTPWWIIVVYASTPDIACYIFTLDEIRHRMQRDPGTRSGKPESERGYWLPRRHYTPGNAGEDKDFRDAWSRLGIPR